MVLVGVDIFLVLPFLLLAEYDRNRHKLAVLAEQLVDLAFRSIILRGIVIEEHGYHRSTVGLLARSHLEFGIALAAP